MIKFYENLVDLGKIPQIIADESCKLMLKSQLKHPQFIDEAVFLYQAFINLNFFVKIELISNIYGFPIYNFSKKINEKLNKFRIDNPKLFPPPAVPTFQSISKFSFTILNVKPSNQRNILSFCRCIFRERLKKNEIKSPKKLASFLLETNFRKKCISIQKMVKNDMFFIVAFSMLVLYKEIGEKLDLQELSILLSLNYKKLLKMSKQFL